MRDLLAKWVRLCLFLLAPSLAFAGGYEKPVPFSGKWGGVGGAASSAVSGAEALFFNPAGLAAGDSQLEATGDFSPTLLHFSGPIAGTQGVNSSTSFFPAYGVFASYKVNPKWGIGIGSYLSGGARAIYNNVDFTNAGVPFGQPNNPALAGASSTIQSNLSIIEFSVGTGYEILDGLRIGLAYRMAMVHATLGSYGYDPNAGVLSTLTIDGISGTSWNGFRLGAQYYPRDSLWGVGVGWRSQVNFTGTGTISGAVTSASGATFAPAPAGTTIPFNGGNATVSNASPQAFDIGGHYDVIPKGLRAHLQYTYTNWSVDQQLAIAGGTSFTAGGAAVPVNIPNIDQHWVNEQDLRVGFECFEVQNWIFRAAYVFSSQVTPADRARATFTPPGSGHTIALGAATNWLDNALETDLALEWGFSNADTSSSGAVPPADMTSGALGQYSAYDLAAHLGVTYRM